MDEFWVLDTTAYRLIISEETAISIKRQLLRGEPYIEFTDIFGCEHFVRANGVEHIRFTNAETRQRAAEHNKNMTAEEQANGIFDHD